MFRANTISHEPSGRTRVLQCALDRGSAGACVCLAHDAMEVTQSFRATIATKLRARARVSHRFASRRKSFDKLRYLKRERERVTTASTQFMTDLVWRAELGHFRFRAANPRFALSLSIRARMAYKRARAGGDHLAMSRFYGPSQLSIFYTDATCVYVI